MSRGYVNGSSDTKKLRKGGYRVKENSYFNAHIFQRIHARLYMAGSI